MSNSLDVAVPLWLPTEALGILNKFRILDKLHALLKKRNMPQTVMSFRSFSSLYDEDALNQLLLLCPNTLKFSSSRGNGHPELEFKPAGISKAREDTRYRAVLSVLVDLTKEQLFSDYPRLSNESKSAHIQRRQREWQKVLMNGLPIGFTLDLPQAQQSSSSMIRRGPTNIPNIFEVLFTEDVYNTDPKPLCGKLPSLPPSLLARLDEGQRQEEQTEDGDCGAAAVLRRIMLLPWYANQIIYKNLFPSRKAKFQSLANPLPSNLVRALQCNASIDITRVFQHQALAINALRSGSHVALATETSSGKSLTYNIPVIEACLMNKLNTCFEMLKRFALYILLFLKCNLAKKTNNIVWAYLIF